MKHIQRLRRIMAGVENIQRLAEKHGIVKPALEIRWRQIYPLSPERDKNVGEW